MMLFSPVRWPIVALAASLAMLAGAHAFQLAGYAPCALCLRQREVYWGAAGLAVAAIILPRVWNNPLLPRTFCVLLGIAFLAGAGVAFFHAGVEYKIFPSPPCTVAGGPASAESLAALLDGKTKAVPCDEAAWRDPVLAISMAGWNGLISVLLAGVSLFAAARGPGGHSRD